MDRFALTMPFHDPSVSPHYVHVTVKDPEKPRILFTSVFGPYAQDDEYGSRSINPMELYHNQVTRMQGPFSLRMFHRSWGTMLIQANISAPGGRPQRSRSVCIFCPFHSSARIALGAGAGLFLQNLRVPLSN
jgi:hypothetical protein